MKTSCNRYQSKRALRLSLPLLVFGLIGVHAFGQRLRPVEQDVSYGSHERHVLDFWKAESESGKPTPLLISIHGGGFRGGRKGVGSALLKACLEEGVSVAAITYRLSGEAKAPAAFHDVARAVQFLRSKAGDWNLDQERFAATGNSAGAGLSLWLAFHDDMADATSDDPVKSQSTRLKCAFVFNGQTTYDPREIKKLFPELNVHAHPALEQLYDVKLDDLNAVPKEKLAIMQEVSPLTHLSADDPPVMLSYRSNFDTEVTSQGVGIHHARFGKRLKEMMDPLEIPCRVEPGTKVQSTAQAMQFLKRYLLGEEAADEQ